MPQDFHLAKRYYDQAASFDFNAQLLGVAGVRFLEAQKTLHTHIGFEYTEKIIGN